MKLNKIEFVTYDDGEIYPGEVTVTMTRAEMVAIARVFGAMNGYAQRKLEIDSSIYDCLVGDVIDRYWEDGTGEFGPKVVLGTLNDPPIESSR